MSEPTGWEIVAGWIEASRWDVAIVPAGDARGRQELEHLEITTRSPLGAIVRSSAGLLVDHGWLRVLGAGGSDRLADGVNQWSGRTGLLVVGHDAAGGFFSWDEERGVLYHAPGSGEVEDLGGRGYSDWLDGMLGGNLPQFYSGDRFPGWEEATGRLTGDQGFGPDRGVVPMAELWDRFHNGS
jgi:hypothetical protein